MCTKSEGGGGKKTPPSKNLRIVAPLQFIAFNFRLVHFTVVLCVPLL